MNTMPTSNTEAALELDAMRKARDLTYAMIARRTGKNQMWVRRKLLGISNLKIDDYSLLKDSITAFPMKANSEV